MYPARSLVATLVVRLLSFVLPFRTTRPSLEEADVIQNQVVAQDFIGKRGSAVNVSEHPRFTCTECCCCAVLTLAVCV